MTKAPDDFLGWVRRDGHDWRAVVGDATPAGAWRLLQKYIRQEGGFGHVTVCPVGERPNLITATRYTAGSIIRYDG
jgi:hypothetical protein